MTILARKMKRGVSCVILTVNRYPVCHKVLGELELSFLTGNVQAVGATHVGGSEQQLGVLEVIQDPLDNVDVAAVGRVVEGGSNVLSCVALHYGSDISDDDGDEVIM
jgi:hypothetical protein